MNVDMKYTFCSGAGQDSVQEAVFKAAVPASGDDAQSLES